MPRYASLILAAAMMIGTAFTAAPRAAEFQPIDAEALIKKCWDISEKDRAGSTADMRSGTAKTVGCLENTIVDLVGKIFEPSILTKEQAQKYLDQIGIGSQKLYWLIYNEHDGCVPGCGTMWAPAHLWHNAKILEELIRTMERQTKQYPPK